jgi:hypothetical protein
MNKAYCNSCMNLVPAETLEREGRVFLAKDCPSCGRTETMISGVAERYAKKRNLDEDYAYKACSLNCLECQHGRRPTFLFVDVTNRCNLNCPICINNTPSMGFLFEPPMEYFDQLFRQIAAYAPRPPIQLFGGEPTVREDLFEIIKLAKSYGLPVRVVTNGLKLADEEYCRKLVESRVTILIAFDGSNPETYRVLRASERSLDLKLKALDNIRKIGRAKVALMACIARGFNDQEMPQLLEFLHERRDTVRGIYFMPLAHTWQPSRLDLEPERMTSEDIEAAVNDCFPGVHAEFIPAGVFGRMQSVMDHLGIKPPPFGGAHANCESIYLLVSDGRKYVPLDYYMKTSLVDLVRGLRALDVNLARRTRALERSLPGRTLGKLRLRKPYLKLRATLSVLRVVLGRVRLGRVLRGRSVGKAWHALAALASVALGRKTRTTLERHTNIHDVLQLIVLPFEDKYVLETDRLQRCPNAFAFLDPVTGRAEHVPVCAWSQMSKSVFRRITDYYAAREAARTPAG